MITPALGSVLGFANIRVISSAGEAGRDTFTGMRQADVFKRQVLEQKAGSAAMATAGQPRSGPETTSAPAAPIGSANAAREATQLLGQLASLRDAGVITADEYEQRGRRSSVGCESTMTAGRPRATGWRLGYSKASTHEPRLSFG